MHKSFLLFLFPLLLLAQEPMEVSSLPASVPTAPAPTAAPLPEFDSITEELTSLDALYESIQRRERERETLYQQMQQAVDPVQREALLPRLQELNGEIEALDRRFQTMALKTDISLFVEEPEEVFDWQQKAYQIAEPLFDKLEEMTKESRELAELKDGLALNQERKRTAEEAVESLETLLEANPEADLEGKLNDLKKVWADRKEDAENQVTFYTLQLKQREDAKQSMVEQSGQAAKNFVRTLGLDLLWGILAFAGVFFGMRYTQLVLQKIRPGKKKGRSFSSRLGTIVWTLLSVMLAIGAMLAAFNMTGNIFLVSLTMIFLIGIGWASVKTLPAFIEQIRMMLNIGAVREDEVLVWDGLPWKVNNISFRAELINPSLDGGVITIPTPLLVGQVSRPMGEAEELFPSKSGDWVVLRDGTFGRIAYQNPTSVQLVQFGGSHKVISTPDYIASEPRVLSTGFRIEETFDLDYSHLPDITGTIPAKIKEHLKQVLETRMGEDLGHVDVQVASAAESSLRLGIVVDCKGDAAVDWPYIPMWIQSAVIDLCVQESWKIPFPQLQVHTDKA